MVVHAPMRAGCCQPNMVRGGACLVARSPPSDLECHAVFAAPRCAAGRIRLPLPSVVFRQAPPEPVVSSLLARLEALKVLHSEAAMFSQRLHAAEAAHRRMAASIDEQRAAVDALRAGLSTNLGAISSNMAVIDQRFNRVMEKLGPLALDSDGDGEDGGDAEEGTE